MNKWHLHTGFKQIRHYSNAYNRNSSVYETIIAEQNDFKERMETKIGHALLIDPYPTEFNYKFKEQIRKKFNRMCFLCGKTEKMNGKRLEIHHIDYNKQNIDEKNLIPLCKVCHMRTNHHREYWERNIKKMLCGKLDKIPIPI